MSSFNQTIPMKSYQANTGTVGTTAAQLVAVKDQPAHKGVVIKNLHATQKLYIGRSNVTAVLGYELGFNEELKLELKDPADIFVLGSGADTDYTWSGLPGLSGMNRLSGLNLPNALFGITFADGTLDEFDSTVTDSGDLSATLTAGLRNDLTVVGAELVTNGGFDDWTTDDPDGWTVFETLPNREISEVGTGEGNGGVGTGLCNIQSTDALICAIQQNITTEAGKMYQLTFDIDTVVAGGVTAIDSLSAIYNESYTTTGSKSVIFTAAASSMNIIFRQFGVSDVTIDNVSCKEVTGATYGMQCTIDGTGGIYGTKNIAAPASGALRARFYLDPRQLEMGDPEDFVIFGVKDTATILFQLRLGTSGGNLQLRTLTQDDALGSNFGVAQNITAQEHFVELLMTQAATDSSADGGVVMWIDGALVDTVTGVDNFDKFADIDGMVLGARTSIDVGTLGHLFLDELVVRDDAHPIGE